MQDMLAFYASVVLTAATLIWVVYYKYFRRDPEILVTPPKVEKAEANQAKTEAAKISKETAETKAELNNTISESDKCEADAKDDFDKAKANIEAGNLSTIKKYLESEGYNVNEIFPE